MMGQPAEDQQVNEQLLFDALCGPITQWKNYLLFLET